MIDYCVEIDFGLGHVVDSVRDTAYITKGFPNRGDMILNVPIGLI